MIFFLLKKKQIIYDDPGNGAQSAHKTRNPVNITLMNLVSKMLQVQTDDKWLAVPDQVTGCIQKIF